MYLKYHNTTPYTLYTLYITLSAKEVGEIYRKNLISVFLAPSRTKSGLFTFYTRTVFFLSKTVLLYGLSYSDASQRACEYIALPNVSADVMEVSVSVYSVSV
jgi:hypothetical protein